MISLKSALVALSLGVGALTLNACATNDYAYRHHYGDRYDRDHDRGRYDRRHDHRRAHDRRHGHRDHDRRRRDRDRWD